MNAIIAALSQYIRETHKNFKGPDPLSREGDAGKMFRAGPPKEFICILSREDHMAAREEILEFVGNNGPIQPRSPANAVEMTLIIHGCSIHFLKPGEVRLPTTYIGPLEPLRFP